MRQRNLTLLALTVLAFAAPVASACSVPVFRYALENWSPDPFLAVIYHRGPLNDAQKKVAEGLRRSAPKSNVVVYTVDLNQTPAPAALALWEKHKSQKLPALIVTYALPVDPRFWGRQSPVGRMKFPPAVWASSLTEANVKTVINSPARKEIVKRLLAGETTVWVLSECGDKKADDAAENLLKVELAKLTKLLELPAQDETDYPNGKPAGPPLKIAFSVLRISRKSPSEKMLSTMLIRTENDLETGKYAKQPMVFPIFGRGRALYALVGKGIHPDNILDACGFLTGACSCQVKQQNPGTDLLLTADWDKALGDPRPREYSIPLTGLSAQPATKPATPEPKTPTTKPAKGERDTP